MAKKEVKKTIRKRTSAPKTNKDVEKLNTILIENFVKLQKAMTNLAIKYDNLSIQISKLLQLFEISAKSFAEKLSTGVPELEKDKDFLEKLNKLLDQNKVIAKGLTLMEEKLREKLYGTSKPVYPPRRFPPQALPPPSTPPPQQGYLPSSMGIKKTREVE